MGELGVAGAQEIFVGISRSVGHHILAKDSAIAVGKSLPKMFGDEAIYQRAGLTDLPKISRMAAKIRRPTFEPLHGSG